MLQRLSVWCILGAFLLVCSCSSGPQKKEFIDQNEIVLNSGPDYVVPGFGWLYKNGCPEKRLCATVRICIKKKCQTVNNLIIDTGSVGLRIKRSALNKGLRSLLPPYGKTTTSFCTIFGSDKNGKSSPLCGERVKTRLFLGTMQPLSVMAQIYTNHSGVRLRVDGTGQANGILGMAFARERHEQKELTPLSLTAFRISRNRLQILSATAKPPDLSGHCESLSFLDTGTPDRKVIVPLLPIKNATGVDAWSAKIYGFPGLLKSPATFYPNNITVWGNRILYLGHCPDKEQKYATRTKLD